MKFIVITTINDCTQAIELFARQQGWHLLLVGDKKTPPFTQVDNATGLSIIDQERLPFQTVKITPYNHYARKNIGYLYAIAGGAFIIADTDDDNIPYPEWGEKTHFGPFTGHAVAGSGVYNVYQYFTDAFIWPRGFPLDCINTHQSLVLQSETAETVWVWQGLANQEPDVDAIYRLIIKRSVTFDEKPPVVLTRDVWCPFNSQNTLWHRNAFPYLYLPTTVGFRYTDILRGYVAQRGLWGIDSVVGFTSATVYQERNPHDLMNDFCNEVEVHCTVHAVIDTLTAQTLCGQPLQDILTLYDSLISKGLVHRDEMKCVQSWANDLESLSWSSDDASYNY
jgi:hypothetical protein